MLGPEDDFMTVLTAEEHMRVAASKREAELNEAQGKLRGTYACFAVLIISLIPG